MWTSASATTIELDWTASAARAALAVIVILPCRSTTAIEFVWWRAYIESFTSVEVRVDFDPGFRV
jgi:hypothetical protein